jgi:hypothetical protein
MTAKSRCTTPHNRADDLQLLETQTMSIAIDEGGAL